MPWLPDWENMVTKELTLHARNEAGELYDIETMPISIEENDTYRLLEQPLFDEEFRWGDLIKGKLIDQHNLEIMEVLEHCEHTDNMSIIGAAPSASDNRQTTPQPPSLHKNPNLKKIMADGGFWQQDMGGILTIFYPPGKHPEDYFF